MSKTLAKFVFNPYFTNFAISLVELYGKIVTDVRDIVLQELKDIISNQDSIHNDFSTDSFHQWTSTIQPILLHEIMMLPEMTQIVGSYFILPVDTYQELLLTSFQDPTLLKLLKESNFDGLLAEENYNKCPILHQLQFKKLFVYLKENKDEQGLSTIGKWLNGAYCIAQFLTAIPLKVLLELDKVAHEKVNMPALSLLWNLLQSTFTNSNVLQLWDCINELLWAPYTPLFSLIPANLYSVASSAIAVFGNPLAVQLVLVNQLPEILQDAKRSAFCANQEIQFALNCCIDILIRHQNLITSIITHPQKLRQYLQSAPDSPLNLQAIQAALAV